MASKKIGVVVIVVVFIPTLKQPFTNLKLFLLIMRMASKWAYLWIEVFPKYINMVKLHFCEKNKLHLEFLVIKSLKTETYKST